MEIILVLGIFVLRKIDFKAVQLVEQALNKALGGVNICRK